MGDLVKFKATLKTTIAAEFWSCPCRWHGCDDCEADLAAISVEEQARVQSSLGEDASRRDEPFEAAAYLYHAADLLAELELGKRDRIRMAAIRSEKLRLKRIARETAEHLEALNEERSALLKKTRGGPHR